MTFVCTFLILMVMVSGCEPRGRLSDCPHLCSCEEDGTFLRTDCADLGLEMLPSGMSIFTSYLDLSMNNISQLPSDAFSNLHFLEELRLAGNELRAIPKGAFHGLVNLKVLMLQNNQLQEVPRDAFQDLRNLQSLRLDANHISKVPRLCFRGLPSLRHLWLDDNALTEVPTDALGPLAALQAMTLALNKITHIPDRAFANLSSLVVLHINNNRVRSLGKHSFDGLRCLETLDLNYNSLEEFPVAIRSLKTLKQLAFHHNNIRSIPEHAFTGNPALLTIFFYDNPIHFVGKSAFQHLPELRTLSLNGAADITEFPDLTGTHSLERLAITGARITSLPSTLCRQLPNLQMLDLSYNLIITLPRLQGCEKIQKIDLHHNQIQEVQADTFGGLPSLKTLHLGWNQLTSVDPFAFSGLAALTKLDLSSNQLSSLPVMELHALTHLKLAGNVDLQELLPVESFPRLRVVEMPCAFQCCAFLNSERSGSPLGKGRNSSGDLGWKESVLHSPGDNDLEDLSVDLDDEPLSHHSVQCSPTPGPFQPCFHLFGSWLLRGGVWIVAVLSVCCNALVMVSIFLSPTFLSSVKLLVGLLALVDAVMGVRSASLALVDALTFGVFARYGTRWQSSLSCKLTGFLSVFASETSVFLLTVAAVERSVSVRRGGGGAWPGAVKLAAVLCFVVGLAMSAVPLHQVAQQSSSALCVPVPLAEHPALGFLVAQVLVNSLCFLTMTVIYGRLYCRVERPGPEKHWNCVMVRHMAWLLFANCVLYFPVALLSFFALLKLPAVGPAVVSLVLLVVAPLPACINPLLYVLFNPHFKQDLGLVLRHAHRVLQRKQDLRRLSLSSEDAEKQSCDSTQALVPLAASDETGGKSLPFLSQTAKSSHLTMHCVCTL